MLAPTADYSPADHGVEVLVGDSSNLLFQYSGAPVTIGGAKAYESRDYSIGKRCELFFPVSFTRAIELKYDSYGDDIDTCQVLRQVAEASVPKLQHPDAITVDTTKRPFAAWDGCYFLAQLLGQEAQNYTYKPAGIRDPLSGCETTKKKDEKAKSSADLATDPALEIAYDQVPATPKQSRQIAGKVVEVSNYSSKCILTWNQADSGTGNKWYAALLIKVSAATCDNAAPLAEKAIQLIGQQPNDASAQPQRPLLYQPDENDNPAPGACADFGALGASSDCEPYHPVSLPHGTENIMATAANNRDVECAVFLDAVKKHFGPSFQALTWGAHCFFVEPSHSLQFRVNVDPQHEPSSYGARPDLYTDRQETTIAGKPAITFWDKSKIGFDIYLSPYGDLTHKGNLHLHLEALPGRGDASHIAVKLDPAKTEPATQVISQITQTYFTG